MEGVKVLFADSTPGVIFERGCFMRATPARNRVLVWGTCSLPLVKASALRAEDPGFDSRLRRGDFTGSSHTRDL